MNKKYWMANYYGTTVSSGGKLKEGFDNAKLSEIVAKYAFGDGQGDLNVDYSNGELQIWGDCATEAHLKADDLDDCGEVFDQFLEEITPFLAEPLIVSEVGNEKCRYVQAFAYIARPDKPVMSVSLDEAIRKAIEEKYETQKIGY
jgi:hypothetical protein